MLELNVFQQKCKKRLFEKISALGLAVDQIFVKETKGKWYAGKEIYIEASLKGISFWIYEDGTHIKTENVNQSFEVLDYNSDDDLISSFVREMVSLLRSCPNNKSE